GSHPAARRRCRRPRHLSARRSPGRYRYRLYRRPLLHRAGAPSQTGRPMSIALDTSRISRARSRAAARRHAVAGGLAAALVLAFAAALYLGDYPVPLDGVIRSLFSPLTGLTDRGIDFIVLQVRLPRAILALLSGAAFALAGIIFQTLLRNPLASPDIIGIAHGASAAAVFCIIILGWTGLAVSLGAFGGAVLTALAIYLLAWRNGVTAYRVVLIGIGMAAM